MEATSIPAEAMTSSIPVAIAMQRVSSMPRQTMPNARSVRGKVIPAVGSRLEDPWPDLTTYRSPPQERAPGEERSRHRETHEPLHGLSVAADDELDCGFGA